MSSNACFLLREKAEVVCLSRETSSFLPGVKYITCDLADELATQKVIRDEKPDLILNAAGLTNVELCEANFYKAFAANVLPARNLASSAQSLGIKLVHISTDHFSNSNIFRSSEDQIELPQNVYASTKLDADRVVRSINPASLVIRTNFFGWGHSERSSFSDYIISELRSGSRLSLFDDVLYTPILVDQLVEDIFELIKMSSEGIYNICSEQAVTKFEFGHLLATAFGLDSNLIVADQLGSRLNLVKRPFDMSLSNSKFLSCSNNENYPSIKSMLDRLRATESRYEIFNKNILKKHKIISYGKQSINDSDISRVLNVVCNKDLTQGQEVNIFEEELKKVTGAKYAVAVTNWTAGLHLACLALDIGPGDKVVTTPNSFVASANCVEYVGAEVIFCDIDPDTLNLCPVHLEKLCREHSKIKAVIPVHFAGSPCDMDAISKIAKEFGLSIVEDAAHALGGQYLNGDPIGSCAYSEIVGFSFHPVKNIACGEGGALMTNSKPLYDRLLRLRSHGIAKNDNELKNFNLAYTDGERNPWYYEMIELGYNYRITDMQCALGISQLQRLRAFINRRIEIAGFYDRFFSGIEHVNIPQQKQRAISGNHLYVLLIDFEKIGLSRNKLYNLMKSSGVGCHVHYIPICLQPYYAKKVSCSTPNAIDIYSKSVTIPLHPSLRDDEVKGIAETLRHYISQAGHS